MDIFVCIKQVPSTSKVQVDEKTGVLKRDGVAGKMNPYDLYALETALRLREEHGGRVTVGTMGPPQAVRDSAMAAASTPARNFLLFMSFYSFSDSLGMVR